MQIHNTLNSTTGWLSDEYYDGDTDTFWQVDLGDEIEIGTIDIYPNNYRNSSGGNYPYDSPGMSKTDIYDQITGIRIEISKSPRPLPFNARRNNIIWNDTAAFKQLDCTKGFYKRDCNDGKGPQCIVEGLGCPGDCPAGLEKNMKGTADAPPPGTCELNIYNLANMQTLARAQVIKSDYYNIDGGIDYYGFNAALNRVNDKSKSDYCDLIKARYAGVNTKAEYYNTKSELEGLMDPIGKVSCNAGLTMEQMNKFATQDFVDFWEKDVKNALVDVGNVFVDIGNTIAGWFR
jgi:hypothetical protein